ncbi:Ku protein [Streptomyces sp. KLMMK]|uniref:Ku protein n=1 Tax=Streptomyces sp. KLMMK TaxID=3109353 RepID=UPI003FA70ADB
MLLVYGSHPSARAGQRRGEQALRTPARDLRQTDRVAVGKITLRTKESLALLRVHGDLMAVHTMLWPDGASRRPRR